MFKKTARWEFILVSEMRYLNTYQGDQMSLWKTAQNVAQLICNLTKLIHVVFRGKL
jgi:hypothetical protein